MAEPDPLRALEISQNYLIIAAHRGGTFAEEACQDVIAELEAMERDFGMSREMREGLSEILSDQSRDASDRASEASGLIGAVLALTRDPKP